MSEFIDLCNEVPKKRIFLKTSKKFNNHYEVYSFNKNEDLCKFFDLSKIEIIINIEEY